MRRPIIEEPYSKAALLSRRLAVFSLAVACIGILGVARGVALIAVLGGAAAIACGAILLAFLAFAIIWRSGYNGAGQALAGLILATLLLAYPAYLAQQAMRLPRLSDISTDIADPPSFSLSHAALAARGDNTPPSVAIARRKAQIKAYPQIQPILLDLDAKEAFDASRGGAGGKRLEDRRTEAAGRAGWSWPYRCHRHQFCPRLPIRHHVEAKAARWSDAIEIPSVARFGPYDFGANPRNIANFEAALEALVDKK